MKEEIEEINRIIESLNQEYVATNERLTQIRQEYHFYHILEETCRLAANVASNSAEYFEKLYDFLQEKPLKIMKL